MNYCYHYTKFFGLVLLRLTRFLRVLINLRALPLVEGNFLKVVFPLARFNRQVDSTQT